MKWVWVIIDKTLILGWTNHLIVAVFIVTLNVKKKSYNHNVAHQNTVVSTSLSRKEMQDIAVSSIDLDQPAKFPST